MRTLIRSAKIFDTRSPLHGKVVDILVEKGRIVEIGKNISATNARKIENESLCVSPGWIDLNARFCDPGYEFKEDLNSGLRAARKGGFAKVVLMPSTLPVIDNKSQVEYVLRRPGARGTILPCGSISAGMEGKQLSEMFDMHSAGAVAFTDDKKNISTELMLRALEYARNFNGLVISFPFDPEVNPGGQIHEGAAGASLGMKGIPHMAEEIRLSRDLDLLRYTGGRIHFSLISTAKSVDLIRKAKKEGLNVTCAVAAHQLAFLEDDLESFDTNLKVLPPFRTSNDRKALIQGLKDGTIDAICSDHTPEDIEHKVREFEDAEFGISSIESCFAVAYSNLKKNLDIGEIVEYFTTGPAKILGLDVPVIEEDTEANLTIFSTSEKTEFTAGNWSSKSKNSPFINSELESRVIEVIC